MALSGSESSSDEDVSEVEELVDSSGSGRGCFRGRPLRLGIVAAAALSFLAFARANRRRSFFLTLLNSSLLSLLPEPDPYLRVELGTARSLSSVCRRLRFEGLPDSVSCGRRPGLLCNCGSEISSGLGEGRAEMSGTRDGHGAPKIVEWRVHLQTQIQ
jgi:hypothetical protein